MICSWFEQIALKGQVISLKKFEFSVCFWQFLTAFSLFIPRSEALPSLFFKEWWEQFAPFAFYKRANMSNSLPTLFTKERPRAIWLLEKSESLFCSFAHKKRAICTKNHRANSQPCTFLKLRTFPTFINFYLDYVKSNHRFFTTHVESGHSSFFTI